MPGQGVTVGTGKTFTVFDPMLKAPELFVDKSKPVHVNVARPHLSDGGEAFIEWGRASNFHVSTRQAKEFPFEYGGSVTPVPAPPENDDGTQPPIPPDQPSNNGAGVEIFHWVEISREVSIIRVTNPKDSEQYVDIERVDQALFRDERGKFIQLDFNNPKGL